VRWLRGFWRFWYDFLVGDRWELFVGPLAAMTLAAVAVAAGLPAAVVAVLFVVAVVGVGAASVRMALR
jgi:hypothetical protein